MHYLLYSILALLTFTYKIKKAIDSGALAGALFIDLTKAFDSLNHSILETKLISVGVVGPALTLIKSYLHNRQQAVYVLYIITFSYY
uniref:Putative tick transposon n=1 Tax=Rhipicephalus pulchellus TaxID=72859 RepID=L7LY26_RHIPC